MAMIRIMLVDDHEVVRTGLKSFLDSQLDFEVVAEADNGFTAVEVASTVRPDVIVMDISMPGMDGLEATRRMLVVCPDAKVLALSVHDDKQFFLEMLGAGAVGYLSKQSAAEELVTAIHTVAKGNVYFHPSLAMWLLQDYKKMLVQVPVTRKSALQGPMKNKDLSTLSKREIQVLELIANGKSNAEIGELLGISPKTVARHRERLMNKLDIHSSTELVKFSIRSGLISL
jgi:DNA-binding NarL/FixJ family response regulator